jgi:hypothetical protein
MPTPFEATLAQRAPSEPIPGQRIEPEILTHGKRWGTRGGIPGQAPAVHLRCSGRSHNYPAAVPAIDGPRWRSARPRRQTARAAVLKSRWGRLPTSHVPPRLENSLVVIGSGRATCPRRKASSRNSCPNPGRCSSYHRAASAWSCSASGLYGHNWRRMSRMASVAGCPRFLSTAYALRRRSSSVF